MDVDSAIRNRMTVKVLANEALPVTRTPTQEQVGELLELAGWAPFHRACDESHRREGPLSGIEPWRFHTLLAKDCRELRTRLLATPELTPQGKIPLMLAAADALVLATWLPNSAETPSEKLFEPTLGNMEHVAAVSAAIQNLCLAATARGISNYWSSGGVLRSEQLFGWLQIPIEEILLGAIFLFPSDTEAAQVVGSKLREKRTQPDAWSRFVSVTSD